MMTCHPSSTELIDPLNNPHPHPHTQTLSLSYGQIKVGVGGPRDFVDSPSLNLDFTLPFG